MDVLVALKIKYKCSDCGNMYLQKDIFITMPSSPYGFNCIDHKDKNGQWRFEYEYKQK